MLQLSPSLLRRAAEDMGLDPDRAGLEPRHQFRDPQIEHIAWALDAERRAGYPSGLLYTESLGMALAVHLLGRYTAPAHACARGLSKPQLRRVTAYIEDAPRSGPVAGPAGRRRRGQRVAPQDLVQALDGPAGARIRRSAPGGAGQGAARARRAARQSGGARSGLRAPEPHGAVDAARPRGDADVRGARLARTVSVGKSPLHAVPPSARAQRDRSRQAGEGSSSVRAVAAGTRLLGRSQARRALSTASSYQITSVGARSNCRAVAYAQVAATVSRKFCSGAQSAARRGSGGVLKLHFYAAHLPRNPRFSKP